MIQLAPLVLALSPGLGTPAPIVACRIVRGERAAFVHDRAGVLRRLDLDELTKGPSASEHEGRRISIMEQIPDGRLVTADEAGRFVLRDPRTLEASASVELGKGAVAQAIAPKGSAVAIATEGSELVIARFGADGAPARLKLPAAPVGLAFDPDGSRLVAATATDLHLVDLGAEGSATLGQTIRLGQGLEATRICFVGSERIAAGVKTDDPLAPTPSVQLIELASGEVDVILGVPGGLAPLGGFITSLRHHPEDNLLTFGITSAGSIVAYDLTSFDLRWAMDFGGGNPGGLGVHHPAGSKHCFTYGMTANHRVVADWKTGKIDIDRPLTGYSWLDATADDELFIGVKDGNLVVLDAETVQEKGRLSALVAEDR